MYSEWCSGYIDRPELADGSGRADDAIVGKNSEDGWKNKNALVFSTAQIWVNSVDMHTLWMEQKKLVVCQVILLWAIEDLAISISYGLVRTNWGVNPDDFKL